MKGIVFEQFGDPLEVLQLKELPTPEPGPGEVRVRMTAVPVNPSDLRTVEGTYGRLPDLPASPGFEGVGVVEASGGGLLGRRVLGRRVAVLNGAGGNWCEQVVLPAKQAVPVADDLPDEQVATFFVNPATVVVMLEYELAVPPGAWLLQTAAGSTLGRMVIRYARHRGFKTMNVVRRRDLIPELTELGADVVIDSSSEGIAERVAEVTGGAGVGYAIDPVGGAIASAVVEALGPGGRMLLYGTLSDEPISFDPRRLMTGMKQVSGFWLSDWVARRGLLGRLRLIRRVSSLLRQGVLESHIGESFPMDRFADAVRASTRPGGKVILRIDGAVG